MDAGIDVDIGGTKILAASAEDPADPLRVGWGCSGSYLGNRIVDANALVHTPRGCVGCGKLSAY